jgi:hypothetical protein
LKSSVDGIDYAPVINLFFTGENSHSSSGEKQKLPNSTSSQEGSDVELSCDGGEEERQSDQLKRIIYDLAQGLRHLHGLGIIHR